MHWKKRSKHLVEKNYISAYIWHKLFIQIVKCSSFKRLFIEVSMARCSCKVIFSSISVLYGHMSRLRDVYCLKHSDLVEKMISSSGIWHKPFIQIVKYSFPWCEKKTVNLWFTGKILPLLFDIKSVNFQSSGQLKNVSLQLATNYVNYTYLLVRIYLSCTVYICFILHLHIRLIWFEKLDAYRHSLGLLLMI